MSSDHSPGPVGRRRLLGALAIDAVSAGVFLPITLLYFDRVSAIPIQLAGALLTVGSLCGIACGPVMGSLVDRLGAKPLLVAANASQVLGYLLYAIPVTAWVVALGAAAVALGRAAFWASHGTVVFAVSDAADRDRRFAQLNALRNVGFAAGGLAAGAALIIGTEVGLRSAPVAAAAIHVGALVLVSGASCLRRPGVEAPVVETVGWHHVVGDVGFMRFLVFMLIFAGAEMVVVFALPLYLTSVLGLAAWTVSAVFLLNTVLVVAGQRWVMRRVTGFRRWRIAQTAMVLLAMGFLLLAAASMAGVVFAGLVVAVGVFVYTAGELGGGPVLSSIAVEIAAPGARARYTSLVQLVWDGSAALGPAVCAFGIETAPSAFWVAAAVTCGAAALYATGFARWFPGPACHRVGRRQHL